MKVAHNRLQNSDRVCDFWGPDAPSTLIKVYVRFVMKQIKCIEYHIAVVSQLRIKEILDNPLKMS